ncbi:MAG TPA: helix-turn-helix domain-containing protein [Chthoniobacteraceae bacterium]|nr:helix-turn-helix domain-containing protein [Chthoniobacteraceae bacterium]
MLSASRMYQDYARAFTRGTGLPLNLHAPEVTRVIDFDRKDENPFCALMAKTNQTCAACYGLQQKLEAEAQLSPKTLKCFAGLCETAVPVRVGDKLIAFLQTGHILTHRPNRTEFNKVAKTLLSFGAEVDLKQLEEAYFNTRVLSPRQYEALIRLLTIFAEHLGECAEALALQSHPEEPAAITRARTFIADHSQDDLSLAAVASAVNMSACYFSEKFKEITGINFVTYVARTRIEKARHLLQNSKLRVSEIAFEVGFQSLSQFNRAFKQVTGKAPSKYRQSLAG